LDYVNTNVTNNANKENDEINTHIKFSFIQHSLLWLQHRNKTT